MLHPYAISSHLTSKQLPKKSYKSNIKAWGDWQNLSLLKICKGKTNSYNTLVHSIKGLKKKIQNQNQDESKE